MESVQLFHEIEASLLASLLPHLVFVYLPTAMSSTAMRDETTKEKSIEMHVCTATLYRYLLDT